MRQLFENVEIIFVEIHYLAGQFLPFLSSHLPLVWLVLDRIYNKPWSSELVSGCANAPSRPASTSALASHRGRVSRRRPPVARGPVPTPGPAARSPPPDPDPDRGPQDRAAPANGFVEGFAGEVGVEGGERGFEAVGEEDVGGQSFMLVKAPGMSYTDDPGLPMLPEYTAIVAVPFGSRLRLEIFSSETENLGPSTPVPAPHENILWDGEMAVPVQDYVADTDYYRSARTYPSAVAELGAQGTLRHQRLATVILHPF